ncbi:MAG TPA: NAD(P)/FAD-dependent oxidoreductase [Acidimicrobiales bacterium]|nr:NAD(P)/FAD-dependent oxidoreductase [Acidimicrobiales bacterium]
MTDLAADVVVVGLGPGGEHVAGVLAEEGLEVVGIEHRLVGGECPYWGCVPSKMMIRAANALAETRRVGALAGAATASSAWSPVAERIRREATDDWDDRVAVERFEGKGGRFIRGQGRLAGPGRVQVGDLEVSARRAVVLNPGTEPAVPPVPGLAESGYWTNRQAVETEEVPESLVVLGGGAIGLELGQVFSRFGARVSVVEAAERLLPLEEPEAGELVARVLESEGVAVRVGAGAASVDGGPASGVRVTLADGTLLEGDRLLVATGRRARLAELGLETVGLDPAGRAVEVDERMRAAPGLWVIGDVTGKGAFTHMSMYQAGIAVADILGREGPPARYHAVPRVTFTDPEVGSVGLTEAEAHSQGVDVVSALSPLPESARGWIHKVGNDGFIKLVADRRRGVLVGASSVGPSGGEVLSMLTLAVHAGLGLEVLRSMIYAYPTFHRAVQDALDRLGASS